MISPDSRTGGSLGARAVVGCDSSAARFAMIGPDMPSGGGTMMSGAPDDSAGLEARASRLEMSIWPDATTSIGVGVLAAGGAWGACVTCGPDPESSTITSGIGWPVVRCFGASGSRSVSMPSK
jgi:hypothetical protein